MVFLDDTIWWIFVGLIFSSFISLSTHYEDQGIDIVWHEITSLLKSFMHAFKGLNIITLERNSTLHVSIAVFVLLEGILFKVTSTEWLFIIVAISSVLAFEIINSAMERLASKFSDQPSKEIGLIKDASAAAVLVASIAAAVIGILIFFTRFIVLLT